MIERERTSPNERQLDALATAILRDGLLPMGRQSAHLTTDRELALRAGRRKAAHPVLLRIDAHAAHAAGVEFAEGHDRVTLALAVSASFIEPVGH